MINKLTCAEIPPIKKSSSVMGTKWIKKNITKLLNIHLSNLSRYQQTIFFGY